MIARPSLECARFLCCSGRERACTRATLQITLYRLAQSTRRRICLTEGWTWCRTRSCRGGACPTSMPRPNCTNTVHLNTFRQIPPRRRRKSKNVEKAGSSIARSRTFLSRRLRSKGKANGTGIVIAPGGGYQHLAIDKEGHDVARWLNTLGIGAIVLKYRLPGSMRGISQTDLHQVADRIHVALERSEEHHV